ncbi:Insulin-Degrading Enzyme [Manis pentadactyla]|nr:Insulin-Degrading Enzyme [Manis pentadactyla]
MASCSPGSALLPPQGTVGILAAETPAATSLTFSALKMKEGLSLRNKHTSEPGLGTVEKPSVGMFIPRALALGRTEAILNG